MDALLYALAWPLAIVAIAVVFMSLFKPQIAGLIGRTRKVSKQGIEADGPAQTASLEKKQTAAEKLLKESNNPLLVEQEQILSTQLKDMNFGTSEDRVQYVLRQSAILIILREFDAIYHLIFGSQIVALQQLNGSGESGVEKSQIQQIYEFAKLAYGDMYHDFSSDDWLGFLFNKQLVRDDDDVLRITVKGREFLRHLMGVGLPTNKLG